MKIITDHIPTSMAGLDPALAIGLVGVLVFFVISGLVAYLNLQTLRDDNQKIVHSHDVIVALGNLLSDAETGQRGFLFTGNDKYLEPYNTAISAISLADNALHQTLCVLCRPPLPAGIDPPSRRGVQARLGHGQDTL